MTQDLSWLRLEAPRYTSYPSAHHFGPVVSEAEHRQWLGSLSDNTTVSAYVHVPFCNELCWFCGCHTKVTKRYEPIARYVQVLLREIAMVKEHIGGKGKLVNIHFGGGSPSLLSAEDMHAILTAIRSSFGTLALEEVAIELDPRTTTPENIATYAAAGINRISMGIQDFDPTVQAAINRIQPYPMVKSLVEALRAQGLTHLNTDLIYGLPLQTYDRFRDTLEKTLTLAPDRIALFSYAHVPQVKKHQRMINTDDLPNEMEKLALYSLACNTLRAHGYIEIGIDHFAKAGDPLAVVMQTKTMKRNFQGYVTDATDMLIGFGCSSISQFPHGYVQNSASAVEYRTRVEEGKLPTARGWQFKGDDRIRKRVIDALMCFMEVNLSTIRAEFGLQESYFAAELATLREERYAGIVAVEGETVRITTPYRMAARVAASAFDTYRGVAAGRYSKVA